jgi:hypothetical protein
MYTLIFSTVGSFTTLYQPFTSIRVVYDRGIWWKRWIYLLYSSTRNKFVSRQRGLENSLNAYAVYFFHYATPLLIWIYYPNIMNKTQVDIRTSRLSDPQSCCVFEASWVLFLPTTRYLTNEYDLHNIPLSFRKLIFQITYLAGDLKIA